MKEDVFDVNAVLRYIGVSEGQGTAKVHGLFEQTERGEARLSMHAISLGEVHYVFLKYLSGRVPAITCRFCNKWSRWSKQTLRKLWTRQR